MTDPIAAERIVNRLMQLMSDIHWTTLERQNVLDITAKSITTALAEARREVWLEAAGEVQATRLSLDNPPRPIAAINADLNELAYKFRGRSRAHDTD